MELRSRPVAFALSGMGVLGGVLSGICLVSGGIVLWGCLKILADSVPAFLISLPYVVFGLALFAGGLAGLLNSMVTVRLNPDGIALTAFGRVLRRYPAQQMHTIALVQHGLAKYQTTHLYLCTKTVEDLAAERAARIRADDRTRRLAAQRRRTTWQEAFAGDFLRKKAKTVLFAIPGRDGCWLSCNLETIGLLRLTYPQASWLILPEAQSSPMRYAEDSDPLRAVFPDGKKRAVFHQSGVTLEEKGRRTELLAADQIRTIVCTEILQAGGGYYEKYLLLIACAPEALIGAYNRRDMERLKLLKNWELLALNQACCARMPRFDPRGRGKDLVSVCWYPAREEALRQLYPHAAFFDCSNQALFNAVFRQE